MLAALNYYAVFLYGLLIMVFLLNIKFKKRTIMVLSIYSLLSALVMVGTYIAFGMEIVVKTYPIMIHIPIVIVFTVFFKQKLMPVLFVLGTAYVLTSPRKWGGDLIAVLFDNNMNVSWISQIIISVPLLYLIYKYLKPAVKQIIEYSGQKILLLTVIPFIYYIVAYTTTVYSDLLYSYNSVVVGFMATSITYVFYAFLVTYFDEMTKTFLLQNEQNIFKAQVEAAKMVLYQIKDAQTKSAIYNHDLRHHLTLIEGYIKTNKYNEAISYISTINKAIDKFSLEKYCQNDDLNLILSYYIKKAGDNKIQIVHDIILPNDVNVDPTDLCVIVSNGLENAINATAKIEDDSNKIISLYCHSKNDKIFLEIKNPFTGLIVYKNDFPHNEEADHGLGSQSIIAACEKYKGLYSFETKDNEFILKVVL